MKTETKTDGATARPWHLSHQLAGGFSIAHEIAPNCGRLQCVATFHLGGAWSGYKITNDEARENAKLACVAVNEREALLAVGRRLASIMDELSDGNGISQASGLAALRDLANLAAVRKEGAK